MSSQSPGALETQDWRSQSHAPSHTILKVTERSHFSGPTMEAEPSSALEMAGLELTTHRPLHLSSVKTHSAFQRF